MYVCSQAATALCKGMGGTDRPAVSTLHLTPLPMSCLCVSAYRVQIEKCLGTLCDVMGACERIAKTPIPKSYSRHTSRFLTVFCTTLPFVLVTKLGLLTPLAMFVLQWGLFSIEEIGHFIEEPFDYYNKQLTLADMCATIQRDVEDILLRPADPSLDAAGIPRSGYLGNGWYSETAEDPVYGDMQRDGYVGDPVDGVAK